MNLSEMQKAEFSIEDGGDLIKPSSYYTRHFTHLGVQTEGRSLQQVVLDFRMRVGEIFIRYCHLEPETFDFGKFRTTRTYKLQRELNSHLLDLCDWLYRHNKYPPGLKRAFGKWSSFKNPYQNFSINPSLPGSLPLLDNLQLTMLYNLRIVEQDFYLPALILEELQKRKLDLSQILDTRVLKKIEIVSGKEGEKVRYISKEAESSGNKRPIAKTIHT